MSESHERITGYDLEAFRSRLEAVADRLERLERGQIELGLQMKTVDERVKDVIVELGGVPDEIGRDPDRESVRERLHALEQTRYAAAAASAALASLFGRTARIVLVVGAAGGFIFTLLQFFGIGGK